VETIDVAVARVAERDAVEREAELILIEPTQRDAFGPFVCAERIGRLEVDARQLLDRLERAGTGREHGDVGLADLLHLARFALADHDDLGAFARRFRRRLGSGRRVRGRCVRRSRQQDGGAREQAGGKAVHR